MNNCAGNFQSENRFLLAFVSSNVQQITFDEQNRGEAFISHQFPNQISLYNRCIDFVKAQNVYDDGLFANFILFNTSGIARNSLIDFQRIGKISHEMAETLMVKNLTVPASLDQLVQCLNIMSSLSN